MNVQHTGARPARYERGPETTGASPEGQTQRVALVDTATGSSERYAPTLSSPGSTATGAPRKTVAATHARAETRTEVQRKTERDLYWVFEKCRASLEGAIANFDNFAARMNALYDAGEALERAWKAAADREDRLKEIINIIQGLLLDKKPEAFSAEQIGVISCSVAKTMAMSPVAAETADEVVAELERNGLRPFDILG